jgi:hypothetical protein
MRLLLYRLWEWVTYWNWYHLGFRCGRAPTWHYRAEMRLRREEARRPQAADTPGGRGGVRGGGDEEASL